jgi:Flp pilus assembly protein TadG
MMVALPKPTYPLRTFSGARQGLKRSRMHGAVAVEMALLLIPLLLLAFGAAEYGRAIYQYNTLVKSVRDSVRLMSQHIPAEAAADYSLAQTQARCLAVHGNTACSGQSLAPGLMTGMVYVCDSITQEKGCQTSSKYKNVSTGSGIINLVEVGITGYQFNFVFNPLNLMGNAANIIPFNDIRATMRQN